jgi:hypothetical protein
MTVRHTDEPEMRGASLLGRSTAIFGTPRVPALKLDAWLEFQP